MNVAVIFSMDRALQCDSLIQSLRDHAANLGAIKVIWRATSDLHRDAYYRLYSLHHSVDFVPQYETPLGACLRKAVEGSETMCLNVDDQVYFRPVDFDQARFCVVEGADDGASGMGVYSWRLGHLPGLTTLSGRWGFWVRTNDKGCAPVSGWVARYRSHYDYTWHSDGAVYQTKQYLACLDVWAPGWDSHESIIPNDLEGVPIRGGCQLPSQHFGPCEAACMTWQINKEATTKGKYGAPWETVADTELDALTTKFLRGQRVDNEILYTDLSWRHRFQGPRDIPTHVAPSIAAATFYASIIR